MQYYLLKVNTKVNHFFFFRFLNNFFLGVSYYEETNPHEPIW